jgi:hypothetical protein
MRRGVSFDDGDDELDNEDNEQTKKELESTKLMVKTRRAWMMNNNRAIMKRHAQDDTLNCTNMHVPSLQIPITERSHGLLFKVT